MAVVYTLFAKSDPDHIRYVGRTGSVPERLKSHLKEAKNSKKVTRKLSWIRSVIKRNDAVEIRVLETGLTWEEAGIRETSLIAHYKSLGHKLTNGTVGGDGSRGHVLSQEKRDEISRLRKGIPLTEEHKANISKSLKAYTFTEEHRAKLSQSAKLAMTPERKKNLIKAKKGKPLTLEHKAKISDGLRKAHTIKYYS